MLKLCYMDNSVIVDTLADYTVSVHIYFVFVYNALC